MMRIHIHEKIGLAGVNQDEAEFTQKIGHLFEYLMIPIVILLAVQLHLEYTHNLLPSTDFLINLSIWIFFVLETSLLGYLVKNKRRYLRTNWMNLVLIISGLLILVDESSLITFFRILRPILFLCMLLPWLNILINWVSDNSLLTTLMAYLIIIILFGTIVSAVDPAFSNVFDGMWWAMVTIATVGYGDIVPISITGRVLASALIVIGIGFFAIITANFSALFMQKNMQEEIRLMKKSNNRISEVLENLQTVKHEEEEIMHNLEALKLEEEIITTRILALKKGEDDIIELLNVINEKIDKKL